MILYEDGLFFFSRNVTIRHCDFKTEKSKSDRLTFYDNEDHYLRLYIHDFLL